MFGKETIGKNENSSDPYGWNQEAKKAEAFDINETTLSLAELRDQHPKELKEWCLAVEGNGDSEAGVIEMRPKMLNYGYGIPFNSENGEEDNYGREIKAGPYLQAEDFLHAMRDKNPDKTVLMFRQKYDDGEKSGEDYYCVVDTDLDELELPNGYGYRDGSADENNYYTSCEDENGESTAEGEFVICHTDTFFKSRNEQQRDLIFDKNTYNSVKNTDTGEFFPEQFRIKVKKPAGE